MVGHHAVQVVFAVEIKGKACSESTHRGSLVEHHLAEDEVIPVHGGQGVQPAKAHPLTVEPVNVAEGRRGEQKEIKCDKKQDEIGRIQSAITEQGYKYPVTQHITA